MKVTLEHIEKKVGMFKKAPAIQLAVEFSETEKAAIKQGGLADKVFYDPPRHSHYNERMQGGVEVGYLLKGPYPIEFQDITAARAGEHDIREALKNLKAVIEQSTTPLKASDTFEL